MPIVSNSFAAKRARAVAALSADSSRSRSPLVSTWDLPGARALAICVIVVSDLLLLRPPLFAQRGALSLPQAVRRQTKKLVSFTVAQLSQEYHSKYIGRHSPYLSGFLAPVLRRHRNYPPAKKLGALQGGQTFTGYSIRLYGLSASLGAAGR
jgi:hypothetical protein